MHGQQPLGHEAAAAQRADVGPCAAVVPLVDDQRGALAEGFAAVAAHVRFLARVHALVQREVAFLDEALAAGAAHVGLVARVDAQVKLEVLARRQRLAANVAQEVALARVRTQVPAQRIEVREGARAHHAAQRKRARRRLGVRARAVRQQKAHVHKALGTQVAHEALLGRRPLRALLLQLVRQPCNIRTSAANRAPAHLHATQTHLPCFRIWWWSRNAFSQSAQRYGRRSRSQCWRQCAAHVSFSSTCTRTVPCRYRTSMELCISEIACPKVSLRMTGARMATVCKISTQNARREWQREPTFWHRGHLSGAASGGGGTSAGAGRASASAPCSLQCHTRQTLLHS